MTPESVQAMIDQALLQNSTNGDGSHSSHEDNRRNVQTARPCFYADFMKCQPLNFKGTKGVEVLKKKIMDKYCPRGEIKKLEIELWNLKVKENNVSAYTKRFQELTLICTKFVADETEKIDKCLSGLKEVALPIRLHDDACALMSMGRAIKTRLQRREVKQSKEFDIVFKIIDEYSVRVNTIKVIMNEIA
nr:reverse transcriptase domain-containing protein [Tanacetum cinerariifolium]